MNGHLFLPMRTQIIHNFFNQFLPMVGLTVHVTVHALVPHIHFFIFLLLLFIICLRFQPVLRHSLYFPLILHCFLLCCLGPGIFLSHRTFGAILFLKAVSVVTSVKHRHICSIGLPRCSLDVAFLLNELAI